MDPSRNLALQNSKLQIILQQGAPRQGSSETPGSEPETVMPPPPAYHSVVQPTNTIRLPSMHNPYDPFDEEEDKSDDVPEVNINATTQVRGHGNIISIAQMDSMRIANLLSILVHGGIPSQEDIQPQPQPLQSQQQGQGRQVQMDRRPFSKINININCGATVIGDRNIVGPGLGDIARHMQIAQQRQQQQQQQQQQTQQQTQTPRQACGFQVPLQAPIPTPPMSRSSSFGSDGAGGVKRKTEEERDVPAKRVRG